MLDSDGWCDRRVAELAGRLGRTLHSIQFRGGLNPSQWEALRFLTRANSRSRTPGGLAAFLCTTKGTASQTIQTLESKGLVRRSRTRKDRRVVRLDLTSAGRMLLHDDPIRTFVETVRRLPPRTRVELQQGLGRLLLGIQECNGMAPFGICEACAHHAADPSNGADTSYRCVLTGETITEESRHLVCMHYKSRP